MLFCLAALPSWQVDPGAPLTPDPGIMTLDVALPSTSCTPPQQKVKQILGGSDHSLGRASFFLHDQGEFNMLVREGWVTQDASGLSDRRP